MKVWLGTVFWQMEKVRGGEHIDARRNYPMIKGIVLFTCGCYESELFACDQGYISSADSVEKRFLNRSKLKETEFVQ